MQQPVRVLMLFTILNRGGAETMVMNYYRHIDRSKVQFDFVVHREERGAYEDEIEQLGGRIYRMIPLRPWNIPRYKRMIKMFFEEHPEYRIVHGQCSESGLYFYKEAHRRGLPVIIAHAHSSHVPFDMKLPFRTWMKHRIRPYLTNYFSCSKDASEWLFGRHLASKAIILPNAIDTILYRFLEEVRQQQRKAMNIDPNCLVICHVGSFAKAKNHAFLLSVFQQLLQKRPDALLLLIGCGGSEEINVKKKATSLFPSNNYCFLGARNDVPRLLMVADVFVFPSLHEGLPLSLVEAQCSGLPCIVSDTIPQEACLTDLVKCLSLKESPETWADALIKQAEMSRDRTIYSQKIATAGYDIKDNVNWLQNFYLKCQH